MPRRARVLVPDLPLHIVQRGHNRQCCFFQQSDYRMYLDWVKEYADFYGAAVHAYVLMTNHVHLLLSIDDIAQVSGMMKAIAQNYAQYLNRRFDRCGAWWGGRFYSCPVPADRYLLACHRYIELNPVRAGIVASPDQYFWSSYLGNAGFRDDGLLTPHALYAALSADKQTRSHAYRQLFEKALGDDEIGEIRQATNGNYQIGRQQMRSRARAD